MNGHTQHSPADQFVLIEDAARALNIEVALLRKGIACGLVPIRSDNTGTVRVHLSEVPDKLHEKVQDAEPRPELHVAALTDEIVNLKNNLSESDALRSRLEALIIKQGTAIERYSSLLDSSGAGEESPSETLISANIKLAQRDNEIEKLSNILERTYRAIDARDKQVNEQTNQLTNTADKAIDLLARAVREGELSTEQLNMLNQQILSATNTSVRLEHELDERNSVINNQNSLMERMVTLVEQSTQKETVTRIRKRSLWQRLFGGGRGI